MKDDLDALRRITEYIRLAREELAADLDRMEPCWCHGPDYPHNWNATEWCCAPLEKPDTWPKQPEDERLDDPRHGQAKDINRRFE